nr:hypothetical protein [uncultured Psychroserpens sp.]
MNLHSAIKSTICFLLVFSAFNLNAQNEAISEETSKSEDTITNSKQRNVAYSIGYHKPMSSGDNFIGKGLEGKGGFDFKIQVYVYKQFFIGGALGASYFRVKDPAIVGNYKKTRIAEEYLFIGYEFVPTQDIRVGVNASVYGQSNYKNSFAEDVYQKDSARLNSYGFYVTYEISNQFMIFADYSYRVDKTNIDVPASLEDTFRRGTYNKIGIGIKFSFKGKDLINSL